MLRRAVVVLALVGLACDKPGTSSESPPFRHPHDDVLTLFHGQWKATHNSYHVLGELDIPQWHYTHAPLDGQADVQGVRGFELDLHYIVEEDRLEVFHIGVLDPETTCRNFVDCLRALRGWSTSHPHHFPLFVQLEEKSGVAEEQWEAFFTRVEQDILSVWPRESVVAPEDVQRGAPSLAEGLRMHGWPTLAETRGKIIFAWDESDELRTRYTHGMQDLDGRLIFISSDPEHPFAAVAIRNDPVGEAERIAEALAANMLVRTRADSDSVEADNNDTTRLEAALRSGAHIISTDHPAPRPDGGYVVEIPDGTPVRCNPVTTLDAGLPCSSKALEDPAAHHHPL